MASPDRKGLLRLLYVVVFLISMATGTAMELVPVQAEGMGVSLLDIGIMGTGSAAAYTVMTLIAGSLLDRTERLRIFLAFNAASVLGMVWLWIAPDFASVFAARMAMGFIGGAFFVSAGAITADLAPPEALTHAIGRYNLSWMVGFIVGPAFGGAVADAWGYSSLWLILTVVLVAGVAVNVVMVRLIRLRPEPKKEFFDVSAVFGLRYAYLAMVPYALGLGIYFYILPGYMAQLGMSATAIGVLLALSGAVKSAGFYYSERVVGLGARRGLLVGSLLLCASLVTLGLVSTDAGFAFPLAVFGLSNGMIEPIILDHIAHGSPRGSLGATMGVYEGMYGAFTCVSPLAAGYLSELVPVSSVYVALGAVALGIIPIAQRMKTSYE